MERLQKILARAGLASRREAERWILEGRVSVNGTVVRKLGTQAEPSRDSIRVDGKRIKLAAEPVYLALNKPAGVITTLNDPQQRPDITQFLEPLGEKQRVFPVGRLDFNSSGLILLTNDGELADRMTHPRYGVKKVYRARIQPARLSPRALEALREGVEIEDGLTAPAEVRQPAPGVLELTIREGRKRQVRRMVEAVGHRVVELERVAFGPLGLRGLEPGKSRRLTKAEVERLRRLSEPRSGRSGRAPRGRGKPGAKPGAPKPHAKSGPAKPRARRRPQR
jgi:pseudouridine synthase